MGCGDKGYGKRWFLHGSSTLCKPLWGYEGMVVAASLDPQCFRLFWLLFTVNMLGYKTLALLKSSPASAVIVNLVFLFKNSMFKVMNTL